MNLKELKKLVNSPVRLRPVPVRISKEHRILEERDEDWFVMNVENKVVKLQSINYLLPLPATVIHQYNVDLREPMRAKRGFFILESQVLITDQGIKLEPIPRNR
jgi:hypothetical protein